jgi:probable phosphoglycerate mutase
MTGMVHRHARHLYLARHAEPTDDGSALTDRGTRQATLLGKRLAGVPLAVVHHGPLPRAAQTTRVVAGHLSGVTVREHEAAGDYVPHVPGPGEVEPAYAEAVRASLVDVTAEEAGHGADLAAQAIDLLTGPVDGEERHELVVTHGFTIGWLVRHALGAPAWRWWGMSHWHTGLTVIRYLPDRPPTLVVVNDVSHLPDELRS